MQQRELLSSMQGTVLQQSPQTITVTATEPVIFISLPNLQQFYGNLNAAQQNVSYQISYFDFPADQVILKAGDKFKLRFELAFSDNLQIPTNVVWYQTLDPAYFPLDLWTVKEDMVLNAPEFASKLWQRFVSLVHTYAHLKELNTYAGGGITSENEPGYTHQILGLLFMAKSIVDFCYDEATNKYAFIFSSGSSAAQLTEPIRVNPASQLPASVQGKYLCHARVGIEIDQTLPLVTIRRLARILGVRLGKEQYNAGAAVIVQPEDETALVAVFGDAFDPTVVSPFAITHMRFFPETYTLQANLFPFGKQLFYMYGRELPKLSISDFVYVHTSAQSSEWDQQTSQKTDVLAILPRNRSYGQVPKYASQRCITGEFFNNDTLGSVRNIQLRLTDIEGVLLDAFHTPYTLQVTIKFI